MLKKCFISIIFLSSFLGSIFTFSKNESVPYKGVERLSLPENTLIQIESERDSEHSDKEIVWFKTHIKLKRNGKVLWQKTKRAYDDLLWKFAHLVPIRKGKYFSDLNKDDFYEIAILPWHYGNAWFWTAQIFTVKPNKLVKYGEGRYNLEFGANVLLDCRKCWKFDLDKCKNCK